MVISILLSALLLSNFDYQMGAGDLSKEFLTKQEGDLERYTLAKKAIKSTLKPTQTIPKVIHVIEYDKKGHDYTKSIKQKHVKRGWKMKIWKREDVDHLPFEYQQLILDRETIQEQKELFSAVILYLYGGVVVDCEHEAVKALDPLIESYSFFAAFEPPLAKKKFKRRLHIGTSFIGATASHPIIQKWIRSAKTTYQDMTHPDSGIRKAIRKKKYHNRVAYLLFAKAVDEHLENETDASVILPPTYAYPVRPCHIKKLHAKKEALDQIRSFFQQEKPFSQPTKETYLIHHKGGSW